MKPDGQIPAYEWNFSDVNPPVAGMGGPGGLPDRKRSGREKATSAF